MSTVCVAVYVLYISKSTQLTPAYQWKLKSASGQGAIPVYFLSPPRILVLALSMMEEHDC